MLVLLFQALDADSSPNVQYVLSGTNSEDFRIDTFNGVGSIQVNQPLDYETRASYNLFITTTDGQNSNIPGTSANVFIEVLVRYIYHLFEAYKLESYAWNSVCFFFLICFIEGKIERFSFIIVL